MTDVKLYIYDITGGMARNMSMMIIGKQIDAVYHTSIVVYGVQYHFTGGIARDIPQTTPFGKPIDKKDLGKTQIPQQVFEEYLKQVSPKYTADKYDVIKHNCNNFTDDVCQFLVGAGLPKYILNQAEQLLNTPIGQMFKPMLEKMSGFQQNNQGGFN